MTEYTPDKFKLLLGKLVKTPDAFTPDDLQLALEHLLTPDVAQPAQVGAFLAAMHIHRVERRPECLSAAATVLRARALKATIEDDDKDFVVDIVGTGGDGHNTFNVSTAAAIVAAGAGARVVKVRNPSPIPPPTPAHAPHILMISTAIAPRRPHPAQPTSYKPSTATSSPQQQAPQPPSPASHSPLSSPHTTTPPSPSSHPTANPSPSAPSSTSSARSSTPPNPVGCSSASPNARSDAPLHRR